MLAAAIVVFREVLEAAMIVGIVAAAARGLAGRGRWLVGGIAAGVAVSVLVAALTGRLANLADGVGLELFNAGILFLAVAMLAWHLIWMSQHARVLARDARQLGTDVADGRRDLSALAVAVGLAVTREGSETALFLYGLFVAGDGSLASMLAGAAVGLALGVLAGAALYAGFVRIPVRWFFSATSALILLLAAAMASQCARLLIQADLLPSLAAPLWDLSNLLSNESVPGTLLQVLIGYDATPAGMQVIFYAATLTLIASGMRLAQAPQPSPR